MLVNNLIQDGQMTKYTLGARFLMVLLLLTVVMVTQSSATEINIVYISKMPDIETRKKDIGGLAELGTLVKENRKAFKNSMFLHGGDSLAPSAMSSFDRGTHMIDILNDIEPEVMAVNKREFSFKEDELVLRIGEAAFPFISSNMTDPLSGGNLEGVEESQCFDYEDHKVCVIAVLDPKVDEKFLPERIIVHDSKKRTKEVVANLRASGADVIILLTGHLIEGMETLLARDMVNVILHANSDEDAIIPMKGGLYAKQGTGKGNALVLNLLVTGHDNSLSIDAKGQVVMLAGYKANDLLKGKIAYYVERLSEIMDEEVGTTLVPLNTTRKMVRTEENAFANLFTDSLREYYGADVAFLNSGSIRGDKLYEAGTLLTRKDIQSELPFLSESTFINITGKQLQEAIENGLSQVEDVKGGFLQVSGMVVSYCPTKPAGKRVRSISVAGVPLINEKTYSLATDDYLASGGDGFTMLKDLSPVDGKQDSLVIWTIVRAYIEKYREVAPKIEGRLVSECQ